MTTARGHFDIGMACLGLAVAESSSQELRPSSGGEDPRSSSPPFLSGRLVDREGDGIGGAHVVNLGARSEAPSTGTISDSEGAFSLPRPSPGSIESVLEIRAAGFLLRVLDVPAASSSTIDLGTIRLAPAIDLVGWVRNARGQG